MKKYLTFPSKAPYAWLVYWLVGGSLYRLQLFGKYLYFPFKSTYSLEAIVCLSVFLIGALITIMANIQILVNIVRIIKKEESLTVKKVFITAFLLLGIFLVFNPLANNLLHFLTNNTR